MRAGFYPKLAWEGIRKNARLYVPYIITGCVMVTMYYILQFLSELPVLENMSGGYVLKELLPLGSGVIGIFSLLFLFYSNSFLIRQRYREFGLYNVLGMDKRSIGIHALLHTPLVFGGIYLVLLINSLIKVRRSNPIALMQTDKMGERLPKRIWIEAVTGVVCIGIAYYLAISIENPLAALSTFFVAVILVIAGTYELFMSGSVVFCKLLQKNKKYYYKPNHFVSVSSMVYRMRRNGAGLASICILLTMVLVMISSSASLYFGAEDVLYTRYPKGVNITASYESPDGISNENIEALKNVIAGSLEEEIELDEIRAGEIPGLITKDGITVDYASLTEFSLSTYNNVGYLSVISLEDYNRLLGKSEMLADDECLLYCVRTEYTSDTFTMEKGSTYKVKKVLDEFIDGVESEDMSVPIIYIVVNDFESFVAPVVGMRTESGNPMMVFVWSCGFDLDTEEKEIAAANAIREAFGLLNTEGENSFHSYSVESREVNRADFFQTFGGLFFLPLIFAGIHLCFSFSFIWKILMLFALSNMQLVILVMIICFIIFGLFYALVYKITSNAYYTIVSNLNR